MNHNYIKCKNDDILGNNYKIKSQSYKILRPHNYDQKLTYFNTCNY